MHILREKPLSIGLEIARNFIKVPTMALTHNER